MDAEKDPWFVGWHKASRSVENGNKKQKSFNPTVRDLRFAGVPCDGLNRLEEPSLNNNARQKVTRRLSPIHLLEVVSKMVKTPTHSSYPLISISALLLL